MGGWLGGHLRVHLGLAGGTCFGSKDRFCGLCNHENSTITGYIMALDLAK